MVLTIELPDIETFEKVRVRLDEPRVITFKNNKKTNPNRTTLIPSELSIYDLVAGVYLIKQNDKVVYVGETDNINTRMRQHKLLSKNPDIKDIYLLRIAEKKKRRFMELLYKYALLKKVDFEYYHG